MHWIRICERINFHFLPKGMIKEADKNDDKEESEHTQRYYQAQVHFTPCWSLHCCRRRCSVRSKIWFQPKGSL